MLWVNPPDEADESPIMPLGSKRSITVYDRVVVGSDATPTSLYAVDRAAEVAQAAQAKLIVVAAYMAGDPSTASRPVDDGLHRDLYGAEAARKALEKSLTGLTRERARYIEQRLVSGTRRRLFSTSSRHCRLEPGEPHRRWQPRVRRERGAAPWIGSA